MIFMLGGETIPKPIISIYKWIPRTWVLVRTPCPGLGLHGGCRCPGEYVLCIFARIEVPGARIEVPSARIEVPDAMIEVPDARIEVPKCRKHFEI